MKLIGLEYKRLVSFRDQEDRPANETFGMTVELQEGEDVEEAKASLVNEVELFFLERRRLTETTVNLRAEREWLKPLTDRLKAEHSSLVKEVLEIRALRAEEIYEYPENDLPF